MSDVVLWVAALVVVGVVAWILGARRGRQALHLQVTALLEGLRSGPLIRGREPALQSPALRELRDALAREQESREEERSAIQGERASLETDREALRRERDDLEAGRASLEAELDAVVQRALRRVASYLENRVEGAVTRIAEEGEESSRERAEAVLEAVEDLGFFLDVPDPEPKVQPCNLVEIVQQVTREFTDQSEVLVKLTLPAGPVRVQADPELTKDGLFLLLHNAGEFGGGKPVEVTIHQEEEEGRVRIRDQGPGFTDEALDMAHKPFYSTSPEGLGLGIPHALTAMKVQGGGVALRNSRAGGGEVEVSLPSGG